MEACYHKIVEGGTPGFVKGEPDIFKELYVEANTLCFYYPGTTPDRQTA